MSFDSAQMFQMTRPPPSTGKGKRKGRRGEEVKRRDSHACHRELLSFKWHEWYFVWLLLRVIEKKDRRSGWGEKEVSCHAVEFTLLFLTAPGCL